MSDIENYLILFADLVGSTEVAVEVPPAFYSQTYVASYHWAARRAMIFVQDKTVFPKERFTATIKTIRVAGDEMLTFTPLAIAEDAATEAREDIVASAVSLAYMTKLYWLASPYNLRRMLGKQFPRDVAVGIHIGPAAPVTAADTEQIASLHINVAKRIEGHARSGGESRIFASYEVADLFHGWCRRMSGPNIDVRDRSPLSFTKFQPQSHRHKVKGMSKKLQLLELEWNVKDQESLLYLLQVLTKTLDTEDAATEEAASFLAENFLPNGDILFSEGNGGCAAVVYDPELGQNAIAYIASWFNAVTRLNKLFFDEQWLVLNCFLVSCSFIRHRALGAANRKEYLIITRGILDRYKELLNIQPLAENRRQSGSALKI